jgi:predicted alpha/beta-hydrolase family hydrolase
MDSMENKTDQYKIDISPSIGEVSAELTQPSNMKAVLTLAHGAGAGMNHAFLKQLADALADAAIGTVRFNFPYMEKKKKMVDKVPVTVQTILRVIEDTHNRFPTCPIFGSGKSFGGRMTSHAFAGNSIPYVKGLVFFGFPLHAAGNPSVVRAEHLESVKMPLLFIQGSKDALATPELIRNVQSTLNRSKLVMLEGRDHSFKRGKDTGIQEISHIAASWINDVLA